MKRITVWLFVLLIPVIALIIMGTAETCEKLTTPETITVSNAGNPEVNGTYTRASDINGKPSWSKDSTFHIRWCDICGQWEIQDEYGCSQHLYCDGSGSLPAKAEEDWDFNFASLPCPILSY